MIRKRSIALECPATGLQCADIRCTKKVCCDLQKLRVEEYNGRVEGRERAYWEDYRRREDERPRRFGKKVRISN
jgi:hypothetical protein